MSARTAVLVGLWLIMLWFYGWLKPVLLFTVVCSGIFFGTMFFFALYDAIRTRNGPGKRRPTADGDEELQQLRQMAGLEK